MARRNPSLIVMRDLTMTDRALPDWRERVMARVQEKKAAVAKVKRSRASSITVDFDIPFSLLLKQAAASRGIALGSYVRRCIARQIAKDLGVDWTEVLVHCAAARPHGSTPPGAGAGEWGVKRSFDDGQGFGNWQN